ncbi:hypothetical protein ACOSQ3_005380 [Xanthoceras sorbifolium]
MELGSDRVKESNPQGQKNDPEGLVLIKTVVRKGEISGSIISVDNRDCGFVGIQKVIEGVASTEGSAGITSVGDYKDCGISVVEGAGSICVVSSKVLLFVQRDLGKVLLHPSFGGLPQWAVVSDTFPVGCAFDESIVHHKYFKENADYSNPAYSTKYGVYSEGCRLNNVMMSWGHDDYMYLMKFSKLEILHVAKENKTTLPYAALFIIRYHSFYCNKYDLYNKSKVQIDVEEVNPYYLSLIEKYFPAKLNW